MQLKKVVTENGSIQAKGYVSYLDQRLEVWVLFFQALEVGLMRIMTKDLNIRPLDKHLKKQWGFFLIQARKRIIAKVSKKK